MRLPSLASRRRGWRVLAAFVVLAFAAAAPGEAVASGKRVQLIMVDDPTCRYCRMWNEAVGVGYAKSPEGRIAPLKRVRRGARELTGLERVVYTPTFIVMRDGEEAGRISGYSGPDYFYEDLREILQRAGLESAAP